MHTPASDAGRLQVLTPAQIDEFIHVGYTLLRGGFDPAIAAACRDILWSHIAPDPNDRSTWTSAHVHRTATHREPPFLAAYSERVQGAFDDLCGAGRWVHPGGLGWWPITFPGFASPPWQPPTKGWHVDGQHFHHHLNSPEQGLLAIFIFSEIGPGDGGTAVAPRSHRLTARVLAEAGADGLSSKDMNMRVHAEPWTEVVEANGQPGDILLCHPFLSHSGSANCGERVRFICNVCLPLTAPMNLDRPDGAYSPVELAIRDALDLAPIV